MDIFTTQLTRVVPVPIKPTSLKVKALLKEAASGKLSQDPDHIENHEYYFSREEDQYHASQQGSDQELNAIQKEEEIDLEKTSDGDKDNTKHLDLYA